ncbi:MAG: hypothetical protein LBF68_02680 [Christensenellaceae bacterium]|nr:hypothetical protein [Christensenellaceae bacterium]
MLRPSSSRTTLRVERSISEKGQRSDERIKKAGELMGIPLDDHIIIASDDYVSVTLRRYRIMHRRTTT